MTEVEAVKSKKPRQMLSVFLDIDISPARISAQLRETLSSNVYKCLFDVPKRKPSKLDGDKAVVSDENFSLRVSNEAHVALAAIFDKAIKEIIVCAIDSAHSNKKKQINSKNIYDSEMKCAGWVMFDNLPCSEEWKNQHKSDEDSPEGENEDLDPQHDHPHPVSNESDDKVEDSKNNEGDKVMRAAFNTYVESAIKSVKKNQYQGARFSKDFRKHCSNMIAEAVYKYALCCQALVLDASRARTLTCSHIKTYTKLIMMASGRKPDEIRAYMAVADACVLKYKKNKKVKSDDEHSSTALDPSLDSVEPQKNTKKITK